MGARLGVGTWWPRIVAVIRKVGQQSLAIFVSGLVLSQLLGVALDALGRNALTAVLVNVAGIAIVIGLAYGVAWFKSAPWNAAVPVAAPTKPVIPVAPERSAAARGRAS
jgi:hypothetical protein